MSLQWQHSHWSHGSNLYSRLCPHSPIPNPSTRLCVTEGWQGLHQQRRGQYLTSVTIPSATSSRFPSSHDTAFSLTFGRNHNKSLEELQDDGKLTSRKDITYTRHKGKAYWAVFSADFTELIAFTIIKIYFWTRWPWLCSMDPFLFKTRQGIMQKSRREIPLNGTHHISPNTAFICF